MRQRQEIRERAAQPGEIISNIENFTLENLTVPVGTTVTWVNLDDDAHSTTSGVPDNPTGLWDSPLLNKGDSFSYTFSEPGVYQYFCRPHSSFMRATVTVLGVTATPTPTPLPTPTPTFTPVPTQTSSPTPTETPTPTLIQAAKTPTPTSVSGSGGLADTPTPTPTTAESQSLPEAGTSLTTVLIISVGLLMLFAAKLLFSAFAKTGGF